ncbi:Succinyl-CoA ligase [ADP-forming] subunit beta-like protein [Emericellopsis cladophorae]|uniref:Succinyl-CoA ligase [ADP-forming] subunit beta-like protein n=1 Tax=Emericellopsis cladophorae TaxID=2686198 RepID=A0A9P9Y3J9_9HYPO|nr:Succinyl-CoA ligase [ADP-forming] subunit beta-like protein [Emericellopsis cladophorae]KAI6782680.1 Succinyl-CoA ligase [ADP-forming] subunit beta-like protein [Emericellopsis cladophorae]
MISHKLKTEDTFDEGVIVDKLHISRPVGATGQWYLSLSVDREHYTPCITVSKFGGVSLSSIARDRPETLSQFHFKNSDGISADLMSQIVAQVRLTTVEAANMEAILQGMHQIFVQKDATHLEINPLARLPDESLTCVSASFTFDDAAAKRQPELFALRDKAQAVPEEIEAEKHGLVYVKMDGNIGNVVNGAGLAMATNDAIGLYGGKSANFLDAGGQATKETMVRAFDIVLGDKRVNTILVNVYGGITNCAMIAESIIGAAAELGPLRVPLVIRLQGTNSAQGLKLLEEANLGLHVEADFGAAAEKAVQLSGACP